MEIVIDRAKYAEEIGEPEHLLEPLPHIAPARGGSAVTPFRIAVPTGKPRQFVAQFPIDDTSAGVVDGALVRYGEFKAVLLPTKWRPNLIPGDVLVLSVIV